ncbi:hypothetical protein Tco_0270710 [Tanacetum coccineum]
MLTVPRLHAILHFSSLADVPEVDLFPDLPKSTQVLYLPRLLENSRKRLHLRKIVFLSADEEPVQKGKRVKRSAKKSSTTSAAGIVFRETPVKTKSTGKEKVDVSRGKVAEKPPSVEKITPTVTSEGTDEQQHNEQEASDEGIGQENESEEQESDSEQDEEYDDDNQEEEEVDTRK